MTCVSPAVQAVPKDEPKPSWVTPTFRSTCGSRFCFASEAPRRASLTWSRASASSSRVSSARCTSTSTGSKTSSVAGSAAASGSIGVAGRDRELGPEALERRGERGLRAQHRVARLRRLQLGAEHVELAGEAHLEPRLRGLLERLGALEALARDLEQLPLRDHGVEGRRHLDGRALARERERPLLALEGAARVRELEEGGVRAHAAQQRLRQQQPRSVVRGNGASAVGSLR